MKTSISDYSQYRNTCMRCAHDANMFATFRRHPVLLEIWEHVNEQQGKQYYDIISQHPYGDAMLWRAKDNDHYGNPKTYDYGYYRTLSPTTLRYVKVALDLYDMVGENLFKMNIAEIGGGYGGQAVVINTTGDYCIYDLPEPCSLIGRYTKSILPNSNIYCINTLRHMKDNTKYDLVISNYAWSELTKDVQNDYYNNIISNCDFGYITCNYISEVFGIASWSKEQTIQTFVKDKRATVFPENPLTHNNNMVITWTNY